MHMTGMKMHATDSIVQAPSNCGSMMHTSLIISGVPGSVLTLRRMVSRKLDQ